MTSIYHQYLELPEHYDNELHESYYEIRNELFPNDSFNAMYHAISYMFEVQELKDITNHGMVSGFGSLVYYKDTCAFYDKFTDQIWQLIYEQAESMGLDSMALINTFNGAKNVGSDEQFKNLLCWFAVEETARLFIDDIENNNE